MALKFITSKKHLLFCFMAVASSVSAQLHSTVSFGIQGNFSTKIPKEVRHHTLFSASLQYTNKSIFTPIFEVSYTKIPFNQAIPLRGYSSEIVLVNPSLSFQLGVLSDLKSQFMEKYKLNVAYTVGLTKLGKPELEIHGLNYDIFESSIDYQDLSGSSKIKPFTSLSLQKTVELKKIRLVAVVGAQYYLKTSAVETDVFISSNNQSYTETINANLSPFRYFFLIGVFI